MRGKRSNVFVGGNPWLAWRVEQSKERDVQIMETSKGEKSERLTILISLQFSELPDFVWETIAKRSDERWLLRMHPRFLSEQAAFIEECARRLPKANWEVERSSRDDFYEVMSEADIHVTGWSTTAYEALAFGVPTILIHPNGLDAMGESVERGVFGYADDAESFARHLDSPPTSREETPTILADRYRIVECWRMFS